MAGAVLALTVSAAWAQGAAAPDKARIDEVLSGLTRGRSVERWRFLRMASGWRGLSARKEGAEIRVAPLDDLKKSERVTAAAKPEQHCRESEIVWAPDAKALAFFSDCAKPGEQTDLYLSRAGRRARRGG